MNLFRLWRRYDSIKAAGMLFALAVFLVWYCIRAACVYANILRTPSEYICAVPGASIPAQLADMESVKAYSLQKTQVLAYCGKSIPATLLSARYLAECYGLEETHRVWLNAEAAEMLGGNTIILTGENGRTFPAELNDILPDGQPLAFMGVSPAELHDALELRICMAEPDTAAIGQIGLDIRNREVLCAAEYEQKLVLLRIRFGVLSAFLACLGAFAFLRIYRDFAQK